jgi:acyl-CoA oxidase
LKTFRICRYEGDNFVLDQQVVRAALKSYRTLLASPNQTLPPSSDYLRLLLLNSSPPSQQVLSWDDPKVSILLLDWRAAMLVKDMAQCDESEHDGSVNQRVSKAVTESFIGRQVGEMIESVEMDVLKDLFRLVSASPVPFH